MKAGLRWILLLCLMTCAATAQAHKQSDSYLTLTLGAAGVFEGRWDIALRDLDFVLGLDADADDRITWGEVKAQRAAIERYAFDHLSIESTAGDRTAACTTQPTQLLIDSHVDGAYAVLRFAARCAAAPDQLTLGYSLLSSADPNHHGLLDLRTDAFNQSMVLPNTAEPVQLDLRKRNGFQQLGSFVVEGIWHIWQGYDHILFLMTLLLPAVVLYRDRRWQPRESWRAAAVDIFKVVSAFTVAHSLTLSLAALGLVHAPSRLVESAIALTVLLGALNILFPVVRERRWLVALVFGLVHGLGFASVLADLGLQSASLVRALIGFNVGVEIGQLAIVLLVMPIIYAVRGTSFYRRFALPVGATVIAALALYWIALRGFPDLVPAFV